MSRIRGSPRGTRPRRPRAPHARRIHRERRHSTLHGPISAPRRRHHLRCGSSLRYRVVGCLERIVTLRAPRIVALLRGGGHRAVRRARMARARGNLGPLPAGPRRGPTRGGALLRRRLRGRVPAAHLPALPRTPLRQGERDDRRHAVRHRVRAPAHRGRRAVRVRPRPTRARRGRCHAIRIDPNLRRRALHGSAAPLNHRREVRAGQLHAQMR